MNKFIAALVVAAVSLGAIGASAKGDGGSEARAKLKAAQAEARAANGSDSGDNFFSRLFGDDEEMATDRVAKEKKKTN